MKKKIILTALFCSLIILSAFIPGDKKNKAVFVPQAITTVNTSNDFFNCIFNNRFLPWTEEVWITKHLDKYTDSLRFNATHHYESSTDYYGHLGFLMSQTQVGRVRDVMDSVETAGLRALYGHPNIEILCYSQRLVYEAEGGNEGFSYQTRNPNSSTIIDAGRTVVRMLKTTSSSAGWLCSDIYENLQHSDLVTFNQADEGDWHIKPVMKINTADFNDPNKKELEVIKIFVVNYLGDTLKIIPVKVRNFKNGSGNYDGSYINNYVLDSGDQLFEASGSRIDGLGAGMDDNTFEEWASNSKVDFKVWWSGNVDVWFDGMIVDDEQANDLFSGQYDPMIKQEVNEFYDHGSNYSFFADEVVYSSIRCIQYVDSVMKSAQPSAKLHVALSNFHHIRGFKDNTIGHRLFMEATELNSFNCDAHEIGICKLPPVLNNSSAIPDDWKSSSAADYTNSLQNGALGDKDAINTDEGHFTVYEPSWRGTLIYQVEQARTQRDAYAPDMKFIMQPQIHGWVTYMQSTSEYNPGGPLREPTNEEIEVQAMLSLAHGAEGLCWFWFPVETGSTGDIGLYNPVHPMWNSVSGDVNIEDSYYFFGLYDLDMYLRDENMYGQDKKGHVRDMNIKIEKWKPVLDKIKWTDGFSVHSEQPEHYFIEDIKSIYRNPSSPYEFDNLNEDAAKYWEEGFFQPNPLDPSYNALDKSKYFIMVNRRCQPEEGYEGQGDVRQLKIKFKASELGGFNNWKIMDMEDSSIVATFDKSAGSYIDMGRFEPGEGRLFKLAPVMQEGGTFVTNENLGVDVICKDTVYNDGYRLTIPIGRTIEFAQNVKVEMEGGSFFSCLQGGTPSEDDVLLRGHGNELWNGFQFTDCDTVKIDNTIIQNIENYDPPNTFYAFDVINCDYVKISESAFTGYNSGGIRCTYTSGTGVSILINANTFSMSNNHSPVIAVYGNSAITLPAVIDNNNFTISSSSSSQAIVASNISGAVIKNNDITNYYQSIVVFSSSIDLYNNTIITSSSEYGISGSSGSSLGLRPPGGKLSAGFNTVSTSHEDANNIEVSNSYFYVNGGYNTFDLADNYDDGKHFSGYFPVSEGNPSLDYNCFTEDGNAILPVYDITWGISGDPVSFTFNNDCNAGEGSGYSSKSENNFILVPITDDYNDTIFIKEGTYTLSSSDSMFIEMRKRNYETVIALAENILENSPDIPEATDAVSKLYLASLRLDSTGSRISPLKTFLEQVILDNGENAGLVNRSFYFIQKCKAALGDYNSAMAGFEDIMNNNPNTYEALVASWDYSATALLLNGGSGGARPIFKTDQKLFTLNSFSDDPDDRGKFSKEQKEQIIVNVIKTFEETRKEEINIINKLKERSDRGDRNAGKELKRRELIQNVVKKRQPNDIYEHINSVSSDIKTIFNATGDNTLKNEQNTIPSEYELSQNFPNPFNPVTKIQFALPKDGKVQLVIYDILGREVVKLVNNEFRTAGRYVSEFNGSRLASGVYFYRISVDEGKAFNMVKKMVLVK